MAWYASESRRASASPAKLIGALAAFVAVGFVAMPHGSFRWILLAAAVALGIMIVIKRQRVPLRLDALEAQLEEREGGRAHSTD